MKTLWIESEKSNMPQQHFSTYFHDFANFEKHCLERKKTTATMSDGNSGSFPQNV